MARRNVLAEGTRFDRLVVLEDEHSQRVRVKCDCGERRTVQRAGLRNGTTRSCGCLQRELASSAKLKHGGVGSLTYKSWNNMVQRCTNPRNTAFANYGGRGITVCDRWRTSFEAFLADVGERPSRSHSIDRIDNDRAYERGNVRWASRLVQSNNQRPKRASEQRARFITYAGERLTITQWSQRQGIPVAQISQRIRRGWPLQRALLTPVGMHKQRAHH